MIAQSQVVHPIRSRVAFRRAFESLGDFYDEQDGIDAAYSVLAVLFEAGAAHVGWAGGCVASLLRAGRIVAQTTPHTWAEMMVSQGKLTPQEVEAHEARHIMTRGISSIRIQDEHVVGFDSLTWPVQSGDLLLLSSSALDLGAAEVQMLSRFKAAPQKLAAQLLDACPPEHQRYGRGAVVISISDGLDRTGHHESDEA